MRLVVIIAFIGALTGCAGVSQQHGPPNLAERDTAVRVGADPRIELLGVAQVLTEYFLTTQYDVEYREEVRRYFAPFLDHRAISMFDEMTGEGFRFNVVPDAFMRYSEPPSLTRRMPISSGVAESAGGEAQLDALMAAMADFARESDFDGFYDAHAGYYSQIADTLRPVALGAISPLEAYTGTRLANAAVIFSPVLHDGGFASFFDEGVEQPEAYAFIGPGGATAGHPDFGSRDRIFGLVTHEFGHLIVNPLTETHAEIADRYAGNFSAIAERMQSHGYDNWHTVINEHVLRAITTRLALHELGAEAGAAALADEQERGFVYVPALIEKLAFYEANRDRYPDLESFYSELLTAFEPPLTATVPDVGS